MPQNIDKNPIFTMAADYILTGNHDDADIIFLTGKAGTGKTTLLKHIIKNFKGKAVVMAPTGVAALNAGGYTIHSFLGLEILQTYTSENLALPSNENRKKAIEEMNLLVIDEISMVRCDLLDAVDWILKGCRHCSKPFGGVRTLLVGDVFQLPPVNPTKAWDKLKNNYQSEYFFSSRVFQRAHTVFFELDKVYRQGDADFMDVLNKIRQGTVSNEDLAMLNQRVTTPPKEGCIHLYPTRDEASSLNETKFANINNLEYEFNGIIVGEFEVDSMSNVDKQIRLKVGAQIMTTVNEYDSNGDFVYCNGSIGTVTSIAPDKTWIEVRLSRTGKTVTVKLYTWKNTVREYDKERDEIVEREIGSFTQMPVRLAWAITIHKSQGLTLDNVTVDLTRTFTPGQAYVALSRCRSLSCLCLENPIGLGNIAIDRRVFQFDNELHISWQKTLSEYQEVNRLYRYAWVNFVNEDAVEMIKNIYKALRIKNYLTRRIHESFLEVTDKYVKRYWACSSAALRLPILESNNQELQRRADEAEDSNARLSSKNTELHSKCELQEEHITKLEADNTEKLHKINCLEGSYQQMQQMFIEKTIELDRLKKTPWYQRLFKIGW